MSHLDGKKKTHSPSVLGPHAQRRGPDCAGNEGMPAMAASEESWRLCRELPFDLGPERSVPIRQERWACWERSNTHNCMQDPESTGDGAMAAEETWCGCTTAEVGQPDSFHLSKLDNLFNVFFHQVGQFCWEDKICYTKCSLRCVWWCSMNEWL